MKRIFTAFISFVVLVSFFNTKIPTQAFTEEDAYLYSSQALNLGMKAKKDVVDLSSYMLPASFAKQLYYDVLLSDPYLYFVKMDYTESTCTLSDDGEYIVSYSIEYYFTDTDVTDEVFDDHVEKAISEIPVEGMHTVDQMLAIHEYIANNVDKTEALESVSDERLCSTAYGALVYGCADSLGYALLNMLLAEKITENDCIVVSDADEALFWNRYCLNGNWYNIDVYSDDSEVYYVDGNQTVTDIYNLGSIRNHIYFLETDNIISSYGHSLPVAYVYSGTPESVNDTIRIRIWNNITSPMYYYDGYWYYVSPANPDLLVKRLTNIVATASEEITVFMTDGNIVSFSLTYDSYYYLLDSGKVKKLALDLSSEETIYETTTDTEILIGMGSRDDRVYYESYETTDSSYSYKIVGDVYSELKTPSLENNIFVGTSGSAKVIDVAEVISKTGIVSRFDAYNAIKVSSGETVLSLRQYVYTDMVLTTPDDTQYTIVIYGDVVQGSKTNILDLMTVLNYINGTVTELSDTQMLAMDYDASGTVDIADVSLIYTAVLYS